MPVQCRALYFLVQSARTVFCVNLAASFKTSDNERLVPDLDCPMQLATKYQFGLGFIRLCRVAAAFLCPAQNWWLLWPACRRVTYIYNRKMLGFELVIISSFLWGRVTLESI